MTQCTQSMLNNNLIFAINFLYICLLQVSPACLPILASLRWPKPKREKQQAGESCLRPPELGMCIFSASSGKCCQMEQLAAMTVSSSALPLTPLLGVGGSSGSIPPPPPPPIILRLEWGQPWRYLFKWRDSPSCNLATLKVPLSNDAVTRTNLRVPSLTQFKLKQVYKKENVNVLFIQKSSVTFAFDICNRSKCCPPLIVISSAAGQMGHLVGQIARYGIFQYVTSHH